MTNEVTDVSLSECMSWKNPGVFGCGKTSLDSQEPQVTEFLTILREIFSDYWNTRKTEVFLHELNLFKVCKPSPVSSFKPICKENGP